MQFEWILVILLTVIMMAKDIITRKRNLKKNQKIKKYIKTIIDDVGKQAKIEHDDKINELKPDALIKMGSSFSELRNEDEKKIKKRMQEFTMRARSGQQTYSIICRLISRLQYIYYSIDWAKYPKTEKEIKKQIDKFDADNCLDTYENARLLAERIIRYHVRLERWKKEFISGK